MRLIPSIWLHAGKMVGARGKNLSELKPYELSPIDVAKQFESVGIEEVHVVDLEGFRERNLQNLYIAEQIKQYTGLEVNYTGGIRTSDCIGKIKESGIDTVTIGTLSHTRKDLFLDWMVSFGRENIKLAADSNQRKLVFNGWQNTSDIDVFDHIDEYVKKGIKYVKTTEITRSGIFEGPDIELYTDLVKRFPDISLIAAGGVSSIEDLKKLKQLGLWGVNFGKSFYQGRLTLKEIEEFIAG